MEKMFFEAPSFNQSINGFNTADVTNMIGMFERATSFNQSLSSWDTSKVTTMEGMFDTATIFNQDISNWDTTLVTDMSYMFSSAVAFNNGGELLTWNTSGVENMYNMFSYATAFNQDIGNWNTDSLLSMQFMFTGATAFNQDISAWNIGSVTDFNGLFRNASAFNNGGQSLNWDTYYITNMQKMFYGATSFDQDIGGWDVLFVLNFRDMFFGVTLSEANYDALLIGWHVQNLQSGRTFDGGNSQYCSIEAEAARQDLIDGWGWTVTDGGACAGLGLEDNKIDTILLYPIPVKDVVELMLTKNQNTVKLNLYNITGQLIYSKSHHIINNKISLDLSQINTGIYFLNITTNDGLTTTKKVIK